jgi:CheY-like chemotaxis protein
MGQRRRLHAAGDLHEGREAVDPWQQQPFDLVLMDVQMPEVVLPIAAQASGRDRRRRW